MASLADAAVLQMAPAQGGAQPTLLLLGLVKLLDPIIKLPEESLHGQQFSCGGAIACAARFQQSHGSEQAARQFEQLWQIGQRQWGYSGLHVK